MLGAVREDARAVDHAGLAPLLLVVLDAVGDLEFDAAVLAAPMSLVEQLPVVAGQLLRPLLDPLLIVGVREVGTVVAATGVGLAGDGAVAASPEDARPPRTEPGEVGADQMLLVGGVEELDPLPGKIQGHLALRHVVERTRQN